MQHIILASQSGGNRLCATVISYSHNFNNSAATWTVLMYIVHRRAKVFFSYCLSFPFSVWLTLIPAHNTAPQFCKPLLWNIQFKAIFSETLNDISSMTHTLKTYHIYWVFSIQFHIISQQVQRYIQPYDDCTSLNQHAFSHLVFQGEAVACKPDFKAFELHKMQPFNHCL